MSEQVTGVSRLEMATDTVQNGSTGNQKFSSSRQIGD